MHEIFLLINGMSPYLLLGFLLAGLMHTFVPGKFYTKYLSNKTFRSVINAALLGIPLPLCSCGVIPTAMSLRKEGASKGAAVSFLIATPQTGIDSIMVTFSLMGLPFAIVRPFAALVTALFGGFLTDKTDIEGKCCCHIDGGGLTEEEVCCCHNNQNECVNSCQCHSDESEAHVCHCKTKTESYEQVTCRHSTADVYERERHYHSTFGVHEQTSTCHSIFFSRIKEALTYAYVDMIEDIGKWLMIGLLVAGLITVFVPTEYFAIFQGDTIASMLLVLCISIPMYLCATGSIPIAVALMMKGLTPGAALVMLMAGPACNFASILVIRKSLGCRTMFVYLFSIILGSILFGCLIDWLQYSGTVDFMYQLNTNILSEGKSTGIFEWTCSVVLALMLVNALVLPRLGLRKKKKCCHCE